MARWIFIFLIVAARNLSVGAAAHPNDSLNTSKIITKAKLVRLIDSVFDLKEASSKDIDLLNYYASILKSSKNDTVRISDLNLKELSFYSQKDEQLLFPPIKLEELPSVQTLI